MEPLVVLIAFAAGLGFRRAGYPPLLGYLIAGFIAHSLELGSGEAIAPIADLGITLLLFTIGLKLNIRELLEPQVWGTAGLQMAAVIPLTVLVIIGSGWLFPGIALPSANAAWVLAFALSFSSTVFATKVFEERGESATLHATIAIGVLIIQDLLAVAYLVISSGKLPSLWALGLLALPLARPALARLFTLVGHGELLVLFGMAAAIGGAALFEAVSLKGGLGALLLGVLLSQHRKSTELYKNMLHFKDIFLIGFFLQIGYNGLPAGEMLLVALALGGLIFLRPAIYFFLLVGFGLRARTAMLTGLSLFTYSEFGLIVAALAASEGVLPPDWVTTIAVATSISFFIAMPFNTRATRLYSRFAERLQGLERGSGRKEDRLVDLGHAEAVIVGAGRVGTGAYHYLQSRYPGNVVCVEENADKAAIHRASGINCVHGDGDDRDFWRHAELHRRKLILVSLTNHQENLEVIKLLKSLDYSGVLAVVSRYPDEEREIRELDCISFNLYAEAGHGFAEHVLAKAPLTLKPELG